MESLLAHRTSIELRIKEQQIAKALAEAEYQVRPGIIAGQPVRLLIIEASVLDTDPPDNGHFFHQYDDWWSTMSSLNDECTLTSGKPEILPVNDEGSI